MAICHNRPFNMRYFCLGLSGRRYSWQQRHFLLIYQTEKDILVTSQNMKFGLAVVLLLFIVPCAFAGDAFDLLQGSWRSDREGTIAELKKNALWTPKRLESISELLKDLIVTYKGTKCITKMDGWERRYTFRVVSEKANTVVLEWKDPDLGLQRSTIEVFDDYYWAMLNDNKDFRERFVRLTETQQMN